MHYPTPEEITVIHDRVIEATGGSYGLREAELLHSITVKPQASFNGQDLYPNIYAKAAAIYEALCNYHVFVDGNKRTAALVLYRFLYINALDLTATNQELEDYTYAMAGAKPDLAIVSDWIKNHTRKRTRT